MTEQSDLETQIQAAKEKIPATAPDVQAVNPTAGMGIGLTLVVSIFVCGAMGYAFDGFFATKPWGLIIFLLLGIASGFYSVYKASKGL